MNRTPERNAVEKTVAALDRIAASIDAATGRDLDEARRKALDGIGDSARPTRWLWAAAGAAVLALAVGIGVGGRNGGEHAPLTEQLLADAELYQELEFYEWLSGELESE